MRNGLNSLPRPPSQVEIRRNGKREGGRERENVRVSYYHGTLSLSKFMIRAYNRPTPSLRRFITFNVRNYSSIVSLSPVPLFSLQPGSGPSAPSTNASNALRLAQRDYASRACIGCDA